MIILWKKERKSGYVYDDIAAVIGYYGDSLYTYNKYSAISYKINALKNFGAYYSTTPARPSKNKLNKDYKGNQINTCFDKKKRKAL